MCERKKCGFHEKRRLGNRIKNRFALSGWLLFNANSAIFLKYIMVRTSYIWSDDNDVRFELDQHA